MPVCNVLKIVRKQELQIKMHSKQIKIGPKLIKNRSFFGNKNSGFPNILFWLKTYFKSLFLMSRRQFFNKGAF